MKNRLLGLILLASIAIVYVIYPYYGISAQIYEVAKYALAFCGAWVGIKLLIRN